MSKPRMEGLHTALVTPMTDGLVSFADLRTLVEGQINDGVDGIVVVGTTGESPTLSHKEHGEVVRFCIEIANGRVPVTAGTGSNSTREAVSLTRHAHEAGADAMLQVAPYYNKPSQDGLFQHFSAVAEATDRPIVLYSIPGRCGIEIGVDTVARLRAAYPHINVIKEAGGNCDRVADLITALGDSITVLSGDDSLTLPFMASGAKGVISVASNLEVKAISRMVNAALGNDFETATRIHLQFYPLFKGLFVEPNPVPIKAALEYAGLIASEETRLPLSPMSVRNREGLVKILDQLGYAATSDLRVPS